MKSERNTRKCFKTVHKMFTYEGVFDIDIMTKTQREVIQECMVFQLLKRWYSGKYLIG